VIALPISTIKKCPRTLRYGRTEHSQNQKGEVSEGDKDRISKKRIKASPKTENVGERVINE
jgi:hypothetical protein